MAHHQLDELDEKILTRECLFWKWLVNVMFLVQQFINVSRNLRT